MDTGAAEPASGGAVMSGQQFYRPAPKIIEFDPRRPTPPFNDWIKGLQQHLRKTEGRKRSVEKLIVLHRCNDPFYAGSETDWKYARWFADLFKRLDCQDAFI
jgi:hypothetical protein